MAQYLNDRDLYYEIVISKGKGNLTPKAEKLLILIANRVITKFESQYKTIDDRNDCLQNGILGLLDNWKTFNELEYSQALPYFTEVVKRAMAAGYNIINNRKSYTDDNIQFVSLDNTLDGKGFYGF
jgi:DNA-directed RNA polymerase specialized sigma subunit